MRIRKISICNLKLLDFVEMNFDEDKDITLLYGKNGIGKTTLLESISLLGHLSTMRRVRLNHKSQEPPKVEPSRFWEGLIDGSITPVKDEINLSAFRQVLQSYNKETSFTELVDNLKNSNQNLNEWFNKFALLGSAIRFEVEVYEDRKVVFCVYKREDIENKVSITQALGRKKCDDLRMNECFAVIWESDDSENMEALIEGYFRHCTYIIALETLKLKGRSSDYYFLTNKNEEDARESSIGYVFYLNTDLNDFGRMRDIRESVKDLESDFAQEWIRRFGLKFIDNPKKPGGKEFEYKSELELLMSRIVSRSSPFTLTRGIRDFISLFFSSPTEPAPTEKPFELTECRIKKDGKLELKARREGYGEAQEIDYLSAGENECFFIFLYLLGTDIENSICLLDEPDLHLSQFSKRPFFENLFAMLKEKKCQVIISTHSGFAYTHPRYTRRFLIRRLSKQPPRFDTKFTWSFQLGMAAHYWRTALDVLGIAGGTQMAILVLIIFSTGSFISDIYQQDAEKHMTWTHYFTTPAIFIASILVYIQMIRYVLRDIRGASGWKKLD